jgi:predicted membrane protein
MRILLATLTATMVMGTLPLAAQRDDFRWSGRVAQGKQIEVVGVVGDIRALPASGGQVEVVAEMRDGRVPVRMVDFTVRVPAGVRFAGRSVTGDVRAQGLRGAVRANTVSGEVDVQTSEDAEASTVSGDVRVAMGRLPRSGSLRFNTVSGSVRLVLPSDAGAELRVSTLSGDVDSDFELRMGASEGRRSSWVRVGHDIRATIGRGGPEIEIRTVSGDVELVRGR